MWFIKKIYSMYKSSFVGYYLFYIKNYISTLSKTPQKKLLFTLLVVYKVFFRKWTVFFHFSNDYYLTLDGYFYCAAKQGYFAVFHVRNKRSTEIRAVREIMNNNSYLSNLHPLDGFVIGIVANRERNGVPDLKHTSINTMLKLKRFRFRDKIEPLVEIAQSYTDQEGHRLVVLRLKDGEKSIAIAVDVLSKKYALIYALPPLDAVCLGFEAGELANLH